MWVVFFFFCKQKTAYEMRISDWSSDVCSSELVATHAGDRSPPVQIFVGELVDHRVAKAAFMIVDMVRETQPVGNRARVADILPGTAGADPLRLGAMIVTLQSHPDPLCARPRGKRPAHPRNDPPHSETPP